MLIRMISLMVILASHQCSFGQGQVPLPLNPTLRFGMEIKITSLGVEVAEIALTRPIGTKLMKGDLLRSHELASQRGLVHQIESGADIDAIKAVLGSGETVLLSILRPDDQAGFIAIVIFVSPADLVIPSGVTKTVMKNYTVSAPQADDIGPVGEVFVGVYYATDRELKDGQYSGNRDLGELKYGACNVSLPPDHIQGRLEAPQFWTFIGRDNPAKFVVVRGVAQIGRAEVFRAIGSAFTESGPTRKRVLVFIHGYNVNFENAAKRSAQLHYDLDFPGVTMFYSWPSDGALTEYVSDMADADWTSSHLAKFLMDLEAQDVDDIFILAHSMGNRALLQALRQIQSTGGGKKFKELVLAAADVDSQLFAEQMVPMISSYYNNTTVYASSSDKALWGSQALSNVPRVGEVRNGEPTIAEGQRLSIIDASLIKTDFLGHSYIGDSNSVISDIHQLINHGPVLPRPFLKRVSGRLGPYWEFQVPVAP